MAQENRPVKMNPPIRELAAGDRFCGFYLLKSARIGVTNAGKPYLNFCINDLAGEIPGKLWDYDGPIGAADVGQVVWVSGRIETYQGALQTALDEIRRATADDDFDASRLVPVAPHEPAQMLAYVETTLQKLEDADYRTLCLAMLERHRDAFTTLPGAKMMHHGFLHGLLMHTANMMRQANALARIYSDVIDRDLLIAGAFLHDIGKLAEFSTSELGLVSDYTKEGQLLGHLFLGAEEVGALGRELDIPAEKTLLLQHLLVSHHGRPEFGNIVFPKCAEAEMLSNIDMIDSRMEMFRKAYAETEAGCFSRQKVYGLDNVCVYRPEADGEKN